jgi:hypothetical protein
VLGRPYGSAIHQVSDIQSSSASYPCQLHRQWRVMHAHVPQDTTAHRQLSKSSMESMPPKQWPLGRA